MERPPNNLPVPSPGPEYYLPSQMGEMEAQASPVHLKRLLGFLLKFWWIPVITLLLGSGAAVAYVLKKPPTFVSHGIMWETAKVRLPDGALFSEDVQTFLGTQMELLKSTRLRQAAFARLPTNAIPVDADRKPMEVSIKVSQTPKSSMLIIQSSSADPAFARDYLDALMSEYLDYKKIIRKTISGDTLASISSQVSNTERELQEHQDAWMSFQRTNNYAVLQEESTVAGGYLARLKTQLSDLQLEARLLQATAFNVATNAAGNTNSSLDWLQPITSGPAMAQPSERQTAIKELELLRMQRERLSKYLRPKHPKIAKLDVDIDRAEKLLDIFRRQSHDQLAASRQAIQLKIENVIASIQEWESKVTEANSRVAEAERLKQNISRGQAVYERLVALLRNVDISRSIDQETLSVLEPASAAERTYKEEIAICGFGAFVGLAVGFGIVLLIALRDDRFTSVVEVLEKIPDELVGQVPNIPRLKKGKSPLLLKDGEARHMYLESYRNLRSALLFLAVEGARPKLILITSALPNEGKSTISANLARTLAQGGARVLLVDGDLRKGALHELLGLERGPGLSELLSSSENQENYLQTNCMPNLSFVGCGRRTGDPGDLFLGARLEELLGLWKAQYDYVIIDSTPVFAADDATTLAPKMDGTLFVVRNRFSGAREVQEALALLYRRQARVLGVIYNRADTTSRSYYYYKHADYYTREKPE